MSGAAALSVLMYHSAPESGSGSLLAVPRDLIDRQWAALRSEGWILRGLTEALALSQADPAARVVGLTFDDGYRDFLGVPDLLSKQRHARPCIFLQPTLMHLSTGMLSAAGPRRPRFRETWLRLAATRMFTGRSTCCLRPISTMRSSTAGS